VADSADNIKTYRQMLKEDRRSRVFASLAELLCADGQWEEAAEVCRKGLIFHPDHLGSRVLLGRALMEMGDVHESERILLAAVEDIRKNVMAFKLLSKFAAFSDNTKSAGEYARIYEAFIALGSAEAEVAPSLEIDRLEPALPPIEEVSERDSFKAEAIEEVPGEVSQEIPAPLTPVIEDKPQTEPDEILLHLAQRIEGRLHEKAPPAPILSDDDKKMLKEKIVAVLGA